MNKKNKIKSKKYLKKPKEDSRSFLYKVVRICLLLGLWGGIIGFIIIAWFASELSGITADVKFERKRAVTFQAQNGHTIAQIGELKGETINLQDLPPYLIHALISVEDRRFYSHFGVDPFGIARAMVTNIRAGGFVQGGSTITQQLAKNLFLTPDRNLKRKIQEAILAIWLENRLTKDEILTAYFNRVYFGSGTYGVEAASERYFNKSARDINVYEAALLVGLLKAPTRYSPLNNPDLAEKRTKTVLAAMEDAGYHYSVEPGQRPRLLHSHVADVRQERYFTDWLMDDVNHLIGGAIEDDLIVRTTLDEELQSRAKEIFLEKLTSIKDRKATQGALLVLENNGAVRVMIGGANYGDSQFNRATQAVRQPGSAFKPFVYLTALNRGWKPTDTILDAPITEGQYRPGNFADEYYGEVPLAQALAFSLNTAAVRLAQQIGSIGYVIGTARKLGITSDLSRDMSLALGSSGVSLYEMVSAYSVFPNLGVRPLPFSILSIEDTKGNIYYQYNPEQASIPRLFPQDVIVQLNQMMQTVVQVGTGRAANPGYPAGGKTGTSQDSRDAWFIGFTPRYTAGVWIGNDDNSPMQNITGGGAPAQIWGALMRGADSSPAPALLDMPFLNVIPSENNDVEDKDAGHGFGSMIQRLLSFEEGDGKLPPPLNE